MMFLTQFLPYQTFFLLGMAEFIVGILIWPLNSLGWIPQPFFLHRHIMVFGGVGSFATGFLLTSAPCYTGTKITSPTEYRIFILIHLLFLILTLLSLKYLFLLPLAAAILCFSLALFFIRRSLQAKFNMPKTYHFIGASFLIGTIGNTSELLFSFQPEWPTLQNLANAFSYQACFLLLLIGIGSRLFTGILGLNIDAAKEQKVIVLTCVLLFTILGEAFKLSENPDWFPILRFVSLSLLLFKLWNLQQLPRVKNWETLWVFSFWWFILFGSLLAAVFPQGKNFFHHGTYIAGFLGLTLTVASRIILAHGGYFMSNLTPTFRIFHISFSLLAFSLIVRMMSFFFLNYTFLIVISSLSGLLGVSIWSVHMTPKLLKINSPFSQMKSRYTP
jgi:uncharacterized protein involved in response to NO